MLLKKTAIKNTAQTTPFDLLS